MEALAKYSFQEPIQLDVEGEAAGYEAQLCQDSPLCGGPDQEGSSGLKTLEG